MVLLLAETTTAITEVAEAVEYTKAQQALQIAMSVGPIVLFAAIIYFLMIRPQGKQAKKQKSMLDNLQIADEVVTIGGIIGRVLSIKDDTVLVETGGDKTRIRILRSAIAENRTVHETADTIAVPANKKDKLVKK
jgi:preprotein translocase subunit YajC